jgi:hypothetical protein
MFDIMSLESVQLMMGDLFVGWNLKKQEKKEEERNDIRLINSKTCF